MYQTVQKAANDADECKQMLVKMQRQLDRMEEKQDEMVRGGSLLESKDENKDSSDEEEVEEEEEEQSPGERGKLALVAMAVGAILIGGALLG